ncbi:MAG: HemK family protein methyltransferase [Candidatus Pacebacteria bacterium]|nr:HemK family protein methyltransferase [Candidatus Paceibacterota bacterium]
MSVYRQFTPYEKNQLIKFGQAKLINNWPVADHTPVEYLTGKVEFVDQVFKVNNDVLIPRIETEQLVNLVKTELLAKLQLVAGPTLLRVADVGTGSGVIGVSLFLALQSQFNLEMILSDIDPAALTVAAQNLANLVDPVAQTQFCLLKSDLLTDYDPHFKLTAIVANLPYIATNQLAGLPQSVKNYEPLMALDGGVDGLQYISQLLTQSQQFLTSNGYVFLELTEQAELPAKLTRLAMKKGFSYQLIKDQFHRIRFAVLQRLD